MNGKSDGKAIKNRDILRPRTQPQADVSRGQVGENRTSTAVKPSQNGSLDRQKRPDKNEDYLDNLFE